MSEQHAAENDAPMQVEPCEHFYAWVSPGGSRGWARNCQLCGEPDPVWLDHITEVDRGHGPECVHCWFATGPVTPPAEGHGGQA